MKPCNCPVGCYGKDAPQAIELVTDESVVYDQLAVVAVPAPTPIGTDYTAADAQLGWALPNATSGFQRCILLCRYRL